MAATHWRETATDRERASASFATCANIAAPTFTYSTCVLTSTIERARAPAFAVPIGIAPTVAVLKTVAARSITEVQSGHRWIFFEYLQGATRLIDAESILELGVDALALVYGSRSSDLAAGMIVDVDRCLRLRTAAVHIRAATRPVEVDVTYSSTCACAFKGKRAGRC